MVKSFFWRLNATNALGASSGHQRTPFLTGVQQWSPLMTGATSKCICGVQPPKKWLKQNLFATFYSFNTFRSGVCTSLKLNLHMWYICLRKCWITTCPFPPQVLGSHPQTGFERFERDFYLQIALLRFSISHFGICYEKNNWQIKTPEWIQHVSSVQQSTNLLYNFFLDNQK